MAIGFIKLTGGVTFWADPESLPSLSLGLSVDGRKAGEVLRADLPDVLWTIAVGADLKLQSAQVKTRPSLVRL